MTIKSRLARLEAKHAPKIRHYMLVTRDRKPNPEDKQGYKMQPMKDKEHYTDGEPLFLASWEEVEKFTAAPDVEWTHIDFDIRSASEHAAEVIENDEP
jgi:hypothetical protein